MKRPISCIAAVLGTLLVACPTFGQENGLRRLLKARTSGELNRLVTEQDKVQKLQLVCDAQLRAQRVPGACFELVALNAYLDIKVSWLEELCVARVEESRDWRELVAVINSKFLPSKCRNVALRREADLQYSEQAERPAEVFARLYKH